MLWMAIVALLNSCVPQHSWDGHVYDSSHHKMVHCMHVCVHGWGDRVTGFKYTQVCMYVYTMRVVEDHPLTLHQPATAFVIHKLIWGVTENKTYNVTQ